MFIKDIDTRFAFANEKKKIDHEELGMFLLKNVIAMQYIICLLPTQDLKRYSSGTSITIITCHISRLL